MDKAIVTAAADTIVKDFDWGQLTWYTSGAQANTETMTIGRCVIRPGCENPAHGHPNCEEVLHVLQGEIVHTAEGQEDMRMGVGDTISIPPHIRHNARNVGTDDAVLFICFSSPDRRAE